MHAPSEDECDVCGHLPPELRPIMRETLCDVPLRKLICDKCVIAIWSNLGVRIVPDE